MVATIGFFDGVHRGHLFLIEQVVALARQKGMRPAVITFDRHPRQVLHPDYQPRLLSTLDEKRGLLSRTGVDVMVVLPFDTRMASFSARDFMSKVLAERLNVRLLLIGYDNRFGHNRAESFADYVEFGKELGMEVMQSAAYRVGESYISSSVVREYIGEGDVEAACEGLGYRYTLEGIVVAGYRNGHRLGFPTANLSAVPEGKLIPGNGVYAVEVKLPCDNRLRMGMMNIGIRPTLGGNELSLEVHIFDYTGDLYGQKVSVSFVKRIRGERKFASLDALKAQLEADKAEILSLNGLKA
ncbi:bifunctional riboflavin kinase/FAD synthetase [Prevotella dentasini JCM 15908]